MKIAASVAFTAALYASSSFAQQATLGQSVQQSPLAAREQAIAPILSWMQATGVKLTYLGNEGGLHGYLGEDATGKMQTFYVTPDRQHVVAGLLLRRGGDNVTGIQIGEMRERYSALADQADQESAEMTPASSTNPQVETEVSVPQAVNLEKEAMSEVGADQYALQSGLNLPAAEGPVPGANVKSSAMWLSKIDKDKFLQAASEVPYFDVGSLTAPITIYEIADPQCPYCHAAWDKLKPLVFNKQIKLRVIMISALPGSDKKAKEILASAVPARRWIGSDAGRNLSSEIDPKSAEWIKSGDALITNMRFARQFGMDRTPFLGYVGVDGKFYSSLGLPNDFDAFLHAATAN